MSTGLVEPLRHRDFTMLAGGRTFTELGNAIAPIALAFAVLDLTGSVVDIGVVRQTGAQRNSKGSGWRSSVTPYGIKRYHHCVAMNLRLDERDAAALRAAASEEGRSMQDIVVTALREYLAKRDEFRARHVERFLDEDAELLDLLAE